jgi:hypothetical protein
VLRIIEVHISGLRDCELPHVIANKRELPPRVFPVPNIDETTCIHYEQVRSSPMVSNSESAAFEEINKKVSSDRNNVRSYAGSKTFSVTDDGV